MKAGDAKAECERLETQMANIVSEKTVKALFEALSENKNTWIGAKIVTKDDTRKYQVIFIFQY